MNGENSNKFEENYKEFNFEYKYGKLDRLSKKLKTNINKIEYVVNSKDATENDIVNFSF